MTMLRAITKQLGPTNLLSEIIEMAPFFQELGLKSKEFFNGVRPFSQEGALDLRLIINFLLQSRSRSSQTELFELSLRLGQDCVSKSAFTQARSKIKAALFEAYYKAQVEKIEENELFQETYEGYRLFAVDGTTLYLPCNDATRGEFGESRNQHGEQCLPRCSFLVDLLTGVCLQALLGKSKTSEHEQIYEQLSLLPKNSILILDRLYPCTALMYTLDRLGIRYIIRCKMNWNKAVRKVCSGKGEQDQRVKHPISEKAVTKLKRKAQSAEERKAITCRSEVDYRIMKIQLNDNQYECLLTNLTEDWPISTFKTLYNMRWNIETAIDRLKNVMAIEAVTSDNPEFIRQDFAATIARYNTACVFTKLAQEKYDETKDDKPKIGRPPSKNYPKKINFSLAAAFIAIMLEQRTAQAKDLHQTIHLAFKTIIRFPEPVREDRHFPRESRRNRQRGRHLFWTNFRRTT